MSSYDNRLVDEMKWTQASTLCKVCDQIGTSDARWFQVTVTGDILLAIYIHHPDLPSLKASAFEGCNMCRFLNWTIPKNDNAQDFPKATGGVKNAEASVGMELEAADLKRLLQKHSHELPLTVVSAPPHSWTIAPDLSDDCMLGDDGVQRLQVLSKLCGQGRVILTGFPRATHLPYRLNAVVLSPFGATDFQEIYKFFISGRPFELATGLGMGSTEFISQHLTWIADSSNDQVIHWNHWLMHGKLPRRYSMTNLYVAYVGGVMNVYLTIQHVAGREVHSLSHAVSYKFLLAHPFTRSGFKKQKKKTTKSTIQEHLSGIRVTTLPATIQDAIRLCQALEIPYLWVDSLCILQDDSDEWCHEASGMAAVYGRSALTITTPQNSRCDQGFSATYCHDDLYFPELLWGHCDNRTAVRGSVTVRPQPLNPDGDPFPLSQGMLDSPWMSRGWTLQEWLLSPRVLHCGRERVWDCYETWYTESRVNLSTPFIPAFNDAEITRDDLASHIFARMARLDPTIREGSLDTHWAHLVEQFTSRTLSRELDKMPAIAGLATKFMEHSYAKAPGARYLAGLWHYKGMNPFIGRTYSTSEIPLGLLWRRSGNDPMRSPTAYRAPSWSWAALDGPVKLFRIDLPLTYVSDEVNAFKVIRILEVEAASCLFDPPESFSLVQTGWIIASGLLRRAYLHISRDASSFHFGLANKCDQTFIGLITHRSLEKTHWSGIFDQSLEMTGIHYVEGTLYLLHVATVTHSSDDGQILEILNHALLVERVGSFDDDDCFRRLGVAWYSSKDDDRASGIFFESATEWSNRHMLMDWETFKVRLI